MTAPAKRDYATILPPEMVVRRHECDQAGISVTVMPPGRVRIDWTIPTLSLNFGSPQGADAPLHRIDGIDYPTHSAS